MTRRKILTAFFVLAVLGTTVVRVLGSDWVGQYCCRKIPALVPVQAHVSLSVQACRIDALDLGFRLQGVRLSTQDQPPLTFEADRVSASLSFWTPFDWLISKRSASVPSSSIAPGSLRTSRR